MINDKLKKAREYEVRKEKEIAPDKRPAFHLTPRVGWMNDPNGFSYHNGEYHLFYQYHPYDTNWGPMHWGHAVSKDLLKWEYCPTALAPDESYDNFGCFSGSADTLDDGRQILMYTGVQSTKDEDGKEIVFQTQCIAVGDGTNFEKYEKNPVITADALPEGASKIDFRDPKIWKEKDGTFRCVVGSRPADGSGQILLYSSKDGFSWNFEQILIQNKNRFGKMWECPDFFEVDGKWLLMVSPQDMMPVGLEYGAGNGTLCVAGHLDENKHLVEEYTQSIDYGIDFYAPQTVLAPDGRRIMIGWMQNWDTCGVREDDMKWFGQTSCPREIQFVDGKLIQNPIRELSNYHKNTVSYSEVLISDCISLEKVSGRMIDLEMEIKPEDEENCYDKFVIQFAKNESFHSDIVFYPKESVLEIDRSWSGIRRAVQHQKKCKVADNNGSIKLRVILDRYSVEVFVNDGEQAMSMAVFTEQCADEICFYAEGKVKANVTKSDLEF